MRTEGAPEEAPTTTGTIHRWRVARRSTWIGSGLLVALGAGGMGAAAGWGLLRWEQVDLIRHVTEIVGFEPEPWVRPSDGVDFGTLVAGLALLTWLLASRPDVPARKSLALAGGTFAAWTVVAWFLTVVTAPVWWPGPVVPVALDDQSQLVRSAAPAAYLGPLVVLVAIVGAVWVGSRFRPSVPVTDGSGGPRRPSRLAVRIASGLVGAGVLLGISGVAALLIAGREMGAWEWAAFASLVGRPMVLAVVVSGVAWLVSGTQRGVSILVTIAAAVVLGGDLVAGSPISGAAALVGIATTAVASARRPLAATLDRLTLEDHRGRRASADT